MAAAVVPSRRKLGTCSIPGVVVGGGTGTTIAAIAGAILALTLLAAGGGVGIAQRDAMDRRGRRYGRSFDDDEKEDLGS